jgi:immunoglobulin-binding protein 1
MVEVEEVSNKMQSQMRLDAAAAEDEDLPLPALFDKASRLHSLASSCSLDQVRFRISSPSSS